MIFALPPPPPHPPSLPPAVIFAVRNRCNLPPCVLRVSSGEVMLSSSFFFPNQNWKKKNSSIYVHCMHITEEEEEEEEEGEGGGKVDQ